MLGVVAALTNYVPYVGQFIGGAVPTLVALGQNGSVKEACVVAAVYLAVLGVVEYLITPLVLGRSLDLNGTTVLIACLFWGTIWGLVGLVLAMPITVSMKVICQVVPELNRWAELMSVDWQSPELSANPLDAARPSLVALAQEASSPPGLAPQSTHPHETVERASVTS
jgi:predicted PurR-regulated permease PerM